MFNRISPGVFVSDDKDAYDAYMTAKLKRRQVEDRLQDLETRISELEHFINRMRENTNDNTHIK